VLLRWLQRDPLLAGWSHIIVDEVHERSADTDVLLALLKRLVTARPQLRVVLMSATLDAARLATYMGAACAMVNIPHGHMFAVEEYFVDDLPHVLAKDPSHRRHMQKLVAHVQAARGALGDDSVGQTYDGALCELAAETLVALVEDSNCGETMLCFLPGWDEIRTVGRLLAERGYGDGDGDGDESRQQSDESGICGGGQGPQRDHTVVRVHSLHSRLPLAAQRAALAPAERGFVKVLLATNIAESSLTLPDVTTVVDSGRERTPSWLPEVCSTPLPAVFTIRLSREQAARERPRGTPVWSG
jgi:HrpA-like RNA helicase